MGLGLKWRCCDLEQKGQGEFEIDEIGMNGKEDIPLWCLLYHLI
jgi:hypothetical protein